MTPNEVFPEQLEDEPEEFAEAMEVAERELSEEEQAERRAKFDLLVELLEDDATESDW